MESQTDKATEAQGPQWKQDSLGTLRMQNKLKPRTEVDEKALIYFA